MRNSISPTVSYTIKVWLKSLLVSSIFIAGALRVFTPVDDDLPGPMLSVLMFGLQLIGAIIPALLFSWLAASVAQKTTSGASKKWTLWLAAIIILSAFLGAYSLINGVPRASSSTIITGVDDLILFCFAGNVMGLSVFIWWHDLPEIKTEF